MDPLTKQTITVCLVLVLVQHLTVPSKAQGCAGDMECKHIKDCPRILNNFHSIRNKQYCNLDEEGGTYVCCERAKRKYVQDKDESIVAVRECKAYRNLRKKCTGALIVGGTKADPKELPFMALLYHRDGDRYSWLCGGTLISPKYVLTAAHCFFETTVPNWVRLGELDYATDTDDAAPQDIPIKNIITHSQYFITDIQTKYNDIALIELERKAEFNEYVAPACLPLSDGTEFQKLWAAGWGRVKDTGAYSSHLLKVQLDRFDDKKCFQLIEQTEELDKGINNRTQMCAGSHTDNRDTCGGDSGGPLFVNHPDYRCMFLLVGITSYGDGGCGNAGYPAVYTRVKLYLDWIENIVWDAALGL